MANLNLAVGLMCYSGGEAVKSALEVIKSAGITKIDTAQMYGSNEVDLGAASAAAQGFVISTKNFGGWKKGVALQPDELLRTTRESLKKLGVDQVDIFYIHGPDRSMKVRPVCCRLTSSALIDYPL